MKFISSINAAAFIIALTLCAFLSAAAQEKENTFNDADLQMLTNAAWDKLEGKTYRSTTTSLVFSNGSQTPVRTEKFISEVIPPEREHYVSISETPEGIKRHEYIRVGARRFAKDDDGEWKELGGSGTGNGSGVGNGSGSGNVKIERSVVRTLKKGETINNKKVDLYETVTTIRFIYPAKTRTEIDRTAYWFDANGLFVKTENEYQDSDERENSRTTREYEYNPKNLKIEAPVIKTESKP